MRKITAMLLICVMAIGQLWAQGSRSVSGRVTDEGGAPLVGVTVTAVGVSNVSTITDADGNFSFSVPSGVRSLEFSYVGFTNQRANITTGAMGIVLAPSAASLEEVVVTGYGTKKRVDFTGAAAKVESKAIEQVPIASFDQILQGRAPGLYIASGSGQPGAPARVNIRGVGSISGGNDPLYILDGIPIETAVFRTLNPNDFESVDVLKDAAGAGLYGSRGANGVIVITSKKGRAGKTQFQYRGQVGYSEPPNQWNLTLMNTAQRLEYEEKFLGPNGLGAGFPGWEWSPNNPIWPTLSAAEQATRTRALDSVRNINTDWPSILTRRARFMSHELSASGGNEKLTFFSSVSYFKQEGIIPRSDLQRYTFRTNVDFRENRLSVSLRTAVGYSDQNLIESEAGVALANPIAAAYLELPYRRLRNDAGNVITGAGRIGSNAYDRLFTTTQNLNQYKATLGATLEYRLFGGLYFRTINGVDWRNNNTSRFIDPNSFAGSQVAQGAQGSYNEGISENVQFITTTGLAFRRTFKNVHAVNANLMYEGIRNKFRSFNATGFGINPRLPNTPAGITQGSPTNNFIPLIGGGRTLNGISSVFLTADYTYDRRFTFSGSVRNDAPSQVPKENRQNIFWTGGFNWNLMQEKFMQSNRFFDDLRFRASYGESGNINGFNSDFGFIPTYGNGGYAGVPGIVPTSPGNLDYRLESQVITNIGFDMAFFKNRTRLTVDAYNKESRNLFINQPLSRTTGFLNLAANVGKMRNRGVDIALSHDLVRNRDLIVTLGVNGGFLQNRITDLGVNEEIPQGTGILRVGIPLGSHFTVGWLGVDPQTGQPIYSDRFGNPTMEYSAANNRADFGTFLPSFTGGATADITFKNFSFSTLFTTAQNVSRFNNESFFYETTNSNTGFNKRVELLNSWQRPGDLTNFQRVNTQRQFSSKDVRDASFIRWRNLQIGYTFDPKNAKIFRNIRIWGQGQNLWTWTKWNGFDPEESNNIATYEFPNPTTYTVGLDINF
jgi:TonB-linked SusC/RagA family outer membrane protein